MKVHKNKKWNQIKTNDSWSIFKIMGEFVEGYEKLSAIGPCISIFGSARVYNRLTQSLVDEKTVHFFSSETHANCENSMSTKKKVLALEFS